MKQSDKKRAQRHKNALATGRATAGGRKLLKRRLCKKLNKAIANYNAVMFGEIESMKGAMT